MQILLIDNHDSFSAILHHYLWELTGVKPILYRNDALKVEELRNLHFDAAVLSPGPGDPSNSRDFGICRDLLELYPEIPVLGVCLGHQGLADFAGGRVIPLVGARHGRPSRIRHDGEGLFRELPQGFQAIRYHSLVVDPQSLPENVKATAWSEDDSQIMGLRFQDRPWFGVQFHPESMGSEHGKRLLSNFLSLSNFSDETDFHDFEGSHLSEFYANLSQIERKIRYRKLEWKDPEAVFVRHFETASTAFWLDGSHSHSKSGWPASYMGRADSDFRWNGNFGLFQAELDALGLESKRSAPWPGYSGGPLGYFAYELYHQTLNIPPSGKHSPEQGRWMLPEGYLVFDHSEQQVFASWVKDEAPGWLQSIMDTWSVDEKSDLAATALPPFDEWKPLLTPEEYQQRVKKIQEAIARGETYEACLTHAFSVEAKAEPLAIFRRLRARNPSPYAAYLVFPDLKLLSVSPELFLELSAEGVLRSRPMKGTRPRGVDAEEDARLKQELAQHPKDCAENRMIVDLTRHDFCQVCALGSVEVPSFLEVETHPAVFQLVSEVRGRLLDECLPLDAVESCFPGGSMTGAPKERTVELLSTLEPQPRGVFSGALGYFTHGNSFSLSMVIRTLENRGDSWRIGCGGAVLADSSPEAEWLEATLKARSVIDAVAKGK